MNIISYKENKGYFYSSLTIDALYLNCQSSEEEQLLKSNFWLNPVFENEAGLTKSINYTVSFINKSVDNTNVFIISALIFCSTGLIFIVSLSIYKMGKVRELQVKLMQELETFNSNKAAFRGRKSSNMGDSVLERNEILNKVTLVRMSSDDEAPSGKKKKPRKDSQYASLALSEYLLSTHGDDYEFNERSMSKSPSSKSRSKSRKKKSKSSFHSN